MPLEDSSATSTMLPDTWRQTSADILSKLQRSLQRAIDFSAGVGRKSQDMQKRYKVDFQLSWQVYRIVNEENVIACAPHMPVPRAMKRLCKALRSHEVPEPDVRQVEAAYEAFESHVQHSAGDRSMFDAMIAPLIGGDTAKQAELLHRQASFEAQRYIYGAETALTLVTHFFHPTKETNKRADTVRMSKRCRMTRLNVEEPFILERSAYRNQTTGADQNRYPLDKEAAERFGVPMLPAFSSKPSPPVRKQVNDVELVVEWAGEGVGRPNAVDITLAHAELDVPLQFGDGTYRIAHFMCAIAPVRRSVFDLVIHRPTYGLLDMEVSRWGRALTMATPEAMSRAVPDSIPSLRLPKLPFTDSMEYLGGATSAAYLADVPDYPEMLEFVCRQMNWQLKDFDLYRVAMDYPLIDTMVAWTYRIPTLIG